MRNSGCILVVCGDCEAPRISRELSEINSGYVVSYRRVEDLVLNAPTGKVALVILAGRETPTVRERTLKWLRRRWGDCVITVVDSETSTEAEMTARKGGAMYMAEQIAPDKLSDLVSHVLDRQVQRTIRSERDRD